MAQQSNPKVNRGRRRSKGVVARLKDMWNWDPFADIPTREEYLATRAGRYLWDITRHMPPKERAEERERRARNLIKKICERDKDYEQAVAMWEVFHRRIPQRITMKDYPRESTP